MPEPRLGNFSPLSKERELSLIDQEIARRQSLSTPVATTSRPDRRIALIDQEIARRKEVAPKVKERGVLGELAAGFGRGALGVIAAPAEIADIAGEAIGWEALEKAGESGAKAIEKYIKESPKLKRTESISKNILKNPELWKNPRWYSSIVGEGLPTILSMFIPGMAAAKAAKVAKLGEKGVRAARIAGGLTAGVGLEAAGAASDVRQYEEQTGKAVPISTKLKSVLGTGIVAGSLEYVPIFAMFGKTGASKLVSRVLTGMATEGTTEGAQELVANAFAKAGYDADQNMVDGVVESIVGGVLLGGGMGAVSRATNFKERVDETNPEEVSEILEQTETEAKIPEEQQVEFTRRREETALRTAEERQAAIEAAAPMTTASDETTTLAEEAPRPEPIVEEVVPEEVVPEEIPLVPGAIPAPLRAMGMRPVPVEPIVEKPVVEEKIVEPEAPKIEIPTLTDTTQAIAFGEKATSEQITKLKRLRKKSEARYAELTEEGKLDEAGEEALRAQLFREAFEAKEKPKAEKPEIVEKESWEMAQGEYANLLGDTVSPADIALLADEGKITDQQYEKVKDLKLDPKYITEDVEYEVKNKLSSGAGLHKNLVRQAIKEGKPVPKEVLAEYPDLAPAKPLPPKPPKPKPSEAAREEIEAKPIPEVAPKVEKKEEPGFAWIKGKQKPILSAREITKGKNKGKYEATLTKGRDAEGNIIPGAKKIVTEKEIITMPEERVEVAPVEKAKAIKPVIPGVKPKVKEEKIEVSPTPEGKEITVDLTKKEEAAVTPKQQKIYLLAEIDKAIGEAPKVKPFESLVKEFKKEAKSASPKAYTELLEKQVRVGAERIDKYGTAIIHVPDDGVFTILNTKQSLEEFKKKAKNFPAVEPKAKKVIVPGVVRKAPAVEKIDELTLTPSGSGYFTDGSVIIKGKPPASAKYGKKEITHESIKGILAHETKPTELKYYVFFDPDFGEGVSKTPIPQGLATPIYSPMAVFQSKSGDLYGYNQFRLNAITKRFPKAKYGIGGPGLLVAYENNKPVAALMPIKAEGENALMEKMAIEKGFIEAIPTEKPVEEAKANIKASTTEILKGERGSFSTETKEGAATFEDFSIVGKDFIKRGADTFTKFTEQMKKTFGEVWESVKHLAKELYTRAKAILTEERGEITIREEQPIPIKEEPKVKKLTPAEKAKEAFKVLGIKPKLKPEEPLPKRARSVGLAYQDISEEAKRLEVEMGLEYPKGTRTHAELREQADRIMGDQEQLIKTMEKEKNFTEAEGLVVRRAAATGLESLMKVVATKDIKKANEIHKEFKEGVGKQVQDLHSEFGRNLESLKEKVSPESMSRAFANLERDLNKDDMDMFNSAAEALGQGNAKPMINFQKYLKTTKQDPKIMDYVYEYWYNSILSGVPTHVVNIASNTAWGAWQVGVHKPLLAAIDPLIAKFQKRPTEYYMAEIIPALAGIKRGLKPGIKGAKEVIVKGYTTDAELDKFAADMGSSVGAFARSPNKHLRAIAPFLTMPTRALRAMDIWAKQMNYESELGSVAKRMEKQGKGKYEELLKNPTKDMMNEASQYADYTTFMEKLGKIGTMVEKLRTAVPGGRFIVPFVRTIANLVKRGVEMTPGVGAMKLLGGKVKGKEVTQVLAKQIEGAMIALVIASMFGDDKITGDVPANKAEREAFYRQGKKPWAIKIGDRWYQYRRVEPFNTPVAAVGILYDTWKRTGEEPSTEFAYRSAAGFVNNIIDSSYLSGLTQVLDSVRKADKWPQKLTNMFDKTLASFSPMSSFQRSFVRAIEAIDKEGAILRKPKGALETVAAATPFLSEMVPARKDVWGKEIMIAGTPLEQWLPWKTAKETDDVVEIEIERLHGAGLMSYPGMPAKYMSIGGKRLDLDDEQFDALITESGQASKKKLDSLVGTKYWGMLSDKEKASRIQKIIKDNRKKTRNKIKKEFKVAIPGMVPWKKTKKKKRPAWQATTFGKKAEWQKPMEF